jgi:hypothetical protein
MNPEVRGRLSQWKQADQSAVELRIPLTEQHPLQETFVELRDKIIKRARWLLDFSDQHPLFHGHIPREEVESAHEDTSDFSAALGHQHRNEWFKIAERQPETIKETAEAVAEHGYVLLGNILDKLSHRKSRDESWYGVLDHTDLELDKMPRTQLDGLINNHMELRRVMALIVQISKSKSIKNDPDSMLSLFATNVAFAQVIADKVLDKKDVKKKRKHVVRDQILIFAMYHYDHGLQEYLEALNTY